MHDLRLNAYKSCTTKTPHTGGVTATISNEINMLQQSYTLIRLSRICASDSSLAKSVPGLSQSFFFISRISV